MALPPKIIFLDQNKWIDLFHALSDKRTNSELLGLGNRLIEAIMAGVVIFPLTSNLIVETYKMKDDRNRSQLSEIQAKFSQGLVFRNRDEIIRQEIVQFVSAEISLSVNEAPHFWWLSRNFVEAFVSWQTLSKLGLVEQDQLRAIADDPKFALYHWLATAPANERILAMEAYERGSNELIERIYSRLQLVRDEKFAMRRRAYSANLALSESPRIVEVAELMKVVWLQPGQLDGSRLRKLLRDVPTYCTEIDLAVRIESMNRPVNRNDLGDMQGYVSAIPYSDVIVGENLFINLARQAGLDKKYGCKLETDIFAIEKHL